MVGVSAGVILFLIGLWTVTHPNGGYRAVGGAGSGLTPETRRAAGYGLLVAAIVLIAAGSAGAGP